MNGIESNKLFPPPPKKKSVRSEAGEKRVSRERDVSGKKCIRVIKSTKKKNRTDLLAMFKVEAVNFSVISFLSDDSFFVVVVVVEELTC